MLWSVLLVANKFDSFDAFSTYKKIQDGNLIYSNARGILLIISSTEFMAVGIMLYSFFSFATSLKWACLMEIEYSHP